MGRGEREERGSKYNVCNFYRFIRVKSGIRGKKKRKERRGKEEGRARANLGKRKKERKVEKTAEWKKKNP